MNTPNTGAGDQTPLPPKRGLASIAAVALLALALLFALFRASSGNHLGDVRIGASKWIMVDFGTIVYYPAQAFSDGINPYDAMEYQARYPAALPFRGYPPAVLAVTQPFAGLTLQQAVGLQVGITLTLTTLLAWVSLKLSGVRPTFAGVTATLGLLLLSRPGHWNLLLGQPTVVMVLAVYATLALTKRHSGWAGLALAVTMLKPTFGIPLAIVLLALGRWKALVVGGVVTVLLNLPILAILARRSGGWIEAISLIRMQPKGVDASNIASQFSAFRIDAIAMVSRFAGQTLGLVLPFLIAGAVIGLAAYALRRRLGSTHEGPLDPVSAGVACTAILFCVYHIGYDSLLLAWPATALVVAILESGASSVNERIRFGLLVILALNYLSTFTVLEAIGFDSPLALPIVSVNSLALAGLFGSYVWAALAPEARRP